MCECMSLAAIDNTPAQFVEVLKTVSILLLYFLPFFAFFSFYLFVFLSIHHADQMSEGSQVSKVTH